MTTKHRNKKDCDCALAWCAASYKNGNQFCSVVVGEKNWSAHERVLRPGAGRRGSGKGKAPTGRKKFAWHHYHPRFFKFKEAGDYGRGARSKEPKWVLNEDAAPCGTKQQPPPPGIRADWDAHKWVTRAAAAQPQAIQRLASSLRDDGGGAASSSRSEQRGAVTFGTLMEQLRAGRMPREQQQQLAEAVRVQFEAKGARIAELEGIVRQLEQAAGRDAERIRDLKKLVAQQHAELNAERVKSERAVAALREEASHLARASILVHPAPPSRRVSPCASPTPTFLPTRVL